MRYRSFLRSWGTYYIEDTVTGKQESLKTRDKETAERLTSVKNEAAKNPMLNRQIARAYWLGSDPTIASRTWQDVMEEVVKAKEGSLGHRWKTAVKDRAFDSIRRVALVDTGAEHLLKVLQHGTVSTNVYLRRIHNFALDMNWLPASIIPKRQWPKVKFKEKRAITPDEHSRIIEREPNLERRAFYELCWHLGGSQSDIAGLQAGDIDWSQKLISYNRKKTHELAQVHFGEDVAKILASRPSTGPLFPYLITVRECDRATEFRQRCKGLGITGVTLHSYRYAWAERAKSCGYPERFAQQALGHNSKAVHRAYSRRAVVKVPALEEVEREHAQKKLLPVNFGQTHDTAVS
jgi:integrase